MIIDGLGQMNNAIDTAKVSRKQTEASEFETALQKAFDEGDKKQLKEACNEFESIMLKTLYKQMKATVPEGGFFEKSTARSMFEDMFDDELMDISSQRGMGISDMLYKQLSAKMDKTYKVGTQGTGSAAVASEASHDSETAEPDDAGLEIEASTGAEPIEE